MRILLISPGMMSFEDRISICQYFGVVWHVMLELISTGMACDA
jgi:hypothetical protein